MRRAVIVGLVAIVHLAVSVLSVISSFGAGMARFDTGAPPDAGGRAVALL